MTAQAESNLVIDAATGRARTWASLPQSVLDSPTAVAVARSIEAFPAVAAHQRTQHELLVVARQRLTPDLRAELVDLGLSLDTGDQRLAPTSERLSEPGRIWLLTSGSTGRPKRVAHTLASLTTVTGPQPPRRWLCPYSPGTYAWWQVVTLGLTAPGQDLVVVDPSELESWTAAALDHQVTAASGTPTFWRQSLLRAPEELRRVPLRQISLGGEPVDQAILDQLAATFPEARISWIYASSEAGASIAVHDRTAGFPVEWLDQVRPDRPLIQVDGEELILTSPHHAAGLEGPLRTGDRVEIRDGRVHIVGRIDRDEINVGGSKVSAAAVREVLLAHPAVGWAAVKGRRAPLVGAVVAADVVLTEGADRSTAEQQIQTWCAQRLPEHAVPRRIRVLDTIPAKETLKSDV